MFADNVVDYTMPGATPGQQSRPTGKLPSMRVRPVRRSELVESTMSHQRYTVNLFSLNLITFPSFSLLLLPFPFSLIFFFDSSKTVVVGRSGPLEVSTAQLVLSFFYIIFYGVCRGTGATLLWAMYTLLLVVLVLAPWACGLSCDQAYRALGVVHGATMSEIKVAFRTKALLHHPDKNPDDPKAQDRFVLVRNHACSTRSGSTDMKKGWRANSGSCSTVGQNN